MLVASCHLIRSQTTHPSTMARYYRIMERLALRLTEAFCAGLGLPTHALHPILEKNHTSFCRLNYYPAKSSQSHASIPSQSSSSSETPTAASQQEQSGKDSPSVAEASGVRAEDSNGNAHGKSAGEVLLSATTQILHLTMDLVIHTSSMGCKVYVIID